MLRRQLIRMRWVMATVAIMFAFAFSYSGHVTLVYAPSQLIGGREWIFAIASGQFVVLWDDGSPRGLWSFSLCYRSGYIWPTHAGVWNFGYKFEATSAWEGGRCAVPLWIMVPPFALLGAAGILLHRRMISRGHFRYCWHLLAGATVCPECGRKR